MHTITVLILLLLTGCTSFVKHDCQTADWEKVGYIDGRHGERAAQVSSHQDYCASTGVTVDQDAYQRGYDRALLEYCTESGGYKAGLSKDDYQGICPADKEKAFLAQFEEGRKTRSLAFEKDVATVELQEAKDSYNSNIVVHLASRGYSLISGHSTTEKQEEKVEDADDRIHKRNLSAPEGSLRSLPVANSIDAHSLLEAVGGFGLAVTVGLGVGHAIQHHYYKDGMKWTAIDTVLTTGLAVISNNCPSRTTAHPEESPHAGCSTLAPLTFLAWCASHYFQARETWPYIKSAGQRFHNQVYLESIVPTILDSSPAVASTFRF